MTSRKLRLVVSEEPETLVFGDEIKPEAYLDASCEVPDSRDAFTDTPREIGDGGAASVLAGMTSADQAAMFRDEGFRLLQVGASDEAIACLRNSVALNDEDPLAAKMLASALTQARELEEAVVVWWQVAELCPLEPATFATLGVLFSTLGHHQAAVDAKRHYLSLVVDDAPAHGDLGVLLSRMGRHEEAVEAFEISKLLDSRMLRTGSPERIYYEASKGALSRASSKTAQ